MDTYRMSGNCNNCKETVSINIPKGTSVVEYKKDAECPNCGIKGQLTISKNSANLEKQLKKIQDERPLPFYPPIESIPIPKKRWDGGYEITCNVNTREDLKDNIILHDSVRHWFDLH